jgi:geranylgeranyl diphosphate synthase type II
VTPESRLTEVETALARYSGLTREAMQRYLRDRAPARYLYDLVREYPSRTGKGIRPSLLLATCQAFGGSMGDALGPAVAIELAHNAFLVHDDVEDGSRQRRGRPTLHCLHGTALAVNAGDALAVLALQSLRDGTPLSTRLSQRISNEFLEMVCHTIEGQATELGWRTDNVVDLNPTDYLELIGKKTCWYTTVWPLRVGALIGSAGTAPLEALTRFGFYLGVAFQIRDDLLNLVGSEERYGKELLGDIREGKRTLMLIHLLANASPEERQLIVGFLAQAGEHGFGAGSHSVKARQHARTGGDTGIARVDAEGILDMMVRHGSLEFAFQFGQGVATAAYQSFHEAFADVPPSPPRDFIQALIPYMLARAA